MNGVFYPETGLYKPLVVVTNANLLEMTSVSGKGLSHLLLLQHRSVSANLKQGFRACFFLKSVSFSPHTETP